MTLAFLGEIQETAVPSLIDILESHPLQPFTLLLDQIACWRRGGIVFAGCSVAHDRLMAYQADLHLQLARAGHPLDDRAFVPHITLIRHGRAHAQPLAPPIAWEVDEVRLVRSVTGRGYQTLATRRLNHPDPAAGR